MLKGSGERGAKRIRVHILTDGRDVLDGSSVGFVETLENYLAELRGKGVDAQIASGGGRMCVTMDVMRYDILMSLSKKSPYNSTGPFIFLLLVAFNSYGSMCKTNETTI